MSGKRKKKSIGKNGQFFALPYAVLRSENFRNCSPPAIKLLLILFLQYNGENNGDISCALKILKPHGFTSQGQINYAKGDLIKNGLLMQTRQGHNRVCSLFAFTWKPINVCRHSNGLSKLDVSPTLKAHCQF